MTALAIQKAWRLLRDQERVLYVHPDDISDELRELIDKTPFVSLQPSTIIDPGMIYVLRPGMLDLDYLDQPLNL